LAGFIKAAPPPGACLIPSWIEFGA